MTPPQPGDKGALGGVSGPGQSEEASVQGTPARGKSEPEECKEGVDPKGQPAVGSGTPAGGGGGGRVMEDGLRLGGGSGQ